MTPEDLAYEIRALKAGTHLRYFYQMTDYYAPVAMQRWGANGTHGQSNMLLNNRPGLILADGGHHRRSLQGNIEHIVAPSWPSAPRRVSIELSLIYKPRV